MTYCPTCGGVFNEEAGFCPKCDLDDSEGASEIPPLADLWDLSFADLQALAERQGVRGYRRLTQKSLIWQLDQMRLEQVQNAAEETAARELEEAIEQWTAAFVDAAHSRDVEAAQAAYDGLSQCTDDIHEDIVVTMEWLLLPSVIAAALTVEDIPPLAFQIDDAEVQQAAHAMIEMIGYRDEVREMLQEVAKSTDVEQHLLGHEDHVIRSLAEERRDDLRKLEAAQAEVEAAQDEAIQIRRERIASLDAANDFESFPEHLLEVDDREVRSHAKSRWNTLEEKFAMLELVSEATELDTIADALNHDDEEVVRAAETKRRALLRSNKRDLLRRIENSILAADLPADAIDHSDEEVRAAAAMKLEYLRGVEATVDSISSIYSSEPLEDLLEHEHVRVREAARLRLRILDEIPDRIRQRGERSSRLIKMVDEIAAEWHTEAEESRAAEEKALGMADSVGFSLGDSVDVDYIGQRFIGEVQGFTADGEFVEVKHSETGMVWPVPFDCVKPV